MATNTSQLPGRPSAVIFDMDGLMLDTEVIYHAAWRRAAGDLGYQLDDELFHSLIGVRTEDCEAQILAAMGADFPLADFHKRWEAHWDEHARVHGIKVKPGLIALLDQLDQLGIPKAVATSSTQPEAQRSLRLSGLGARFPVVVTGDQVAHGKPAPDIYLACASRLGIDPAACVAFEDSSPGALAAAAAGMSVYIVPDLTPPTAAARSAAAAVLASLDEARSLFTA